MALVTLGTKLSAPILTTFTTNYQWAVRVPTPITITAAGFLETIGLWWKHVNGGWGIMYGVYEVDSAGVPTTLLARTALMPYTPNPSGGNVEGYLDWANVTAAPGSINQPGGSKLYLPAGKKIILAFSVQTIGATVANQIANIGVVSSTLNSTIFGKTNTSKVLTNPFAQAVSQAYPVVGIYATFQTSPRPTAALTVPADAAIITTATPTLSGTFSSTDTSDTFESYAVGVYNNSTGALVHGSGIRTTTPTEKANKAFNYVYDGPTLVQGTTYKWQADVKALAGGWSGYTGFRTFVYPVPDPVGGIDLNTGAVPASGSKIDRPDLMTWAARWYHNLGQGMDRAWIEIRNPDGTVVVTSNPIPITVSPTIPTAPPGKLFTISLNEQLASGFNPGQLQAGRTYHAYIRGRAVTSQIVTGWAGPLIFRTNALAGTPIPISPADDSIYSTRPELVVRGYDPDPEDVPGTDTVWEFEVLRVSTQTSVVTSAGSYVPGSTPALSEARLQLTSTQMPTYDDYRWRARSVEAAAGPLGTSPWTDWQDVRFNEGPAVSITAPLQDSQVPVGIVRIQWSAGEPQKFYQVQVFQQADNVRRYVTTVITSPNLYHDIPLGDLSPNVPYYVRVTVWNMASVQGTTDDTRFTVVPGAIIPLVGVAVTVEQLDGDVEPTTPTLSWTRSAQPEARFDGYLVRRYITAEGRASAALVAQVKNIGQLGVRDYHAPPGQDLTYLVSQRGAVDSGAITESAAVSLSTRVDLLTPMIVGLESPATLRFPIRHQQGGPPSEKPRQRRTVYQTWGAGGKPTVVKAPGVQETAAPRFTLVSDQYGSASEKRRRIKALIATGTLVSYRNGQDRWWVDIADADLTPGDQVGTWEVSLQLEETAFREDQG